MAPKRQTRGVRNHSGEKEKGGVRREGKEGRKREKEKGNDDSDADSSSSDSGGVNKDDNDDADDDDNGNNVYHERRSHRTREKNL
ncbi:PREDICTED: protein FAM133-like [Acromyrmex echinatior]|uniref:protein FAM133-like n=1 Tax=Acromyrmex echinatior TaxID=103372 RepID=UPI000580F589|nr:PREDICTED: protein FAM133-like [Acromyrmex echinatior]